MPTVIINQTTEIIGNSQITRGSFQTTAYTYASYRLLPDLPAASVYFFSLGNLPF
jgi:hypothetical protein